MSKKIKEKIENLLKEAESLLDPTTFVLNHRIAEINLEIAELQKQCKHNYTNGVCEFCGRGECNE
jgi:hypothetical protein